MQWYEIFLIVLACAFVLGVIIWRVIRRLHGKIGCDECGGSCAGCCHCAVKKEPKQKS